MLIQEIYNKNVRVISPSLTVRQAIDLMDDEENNGYIVADEQKHVLGILSIQDIAAGTIPKQFLRDVSIAKAMYKKGFFHSMCEEIADKPVTAIMRKDFTTVTLEDNIMAIIADFLENDLYIVAVVENKKLIGIVTRTEIKMALSKGMGLIKG